MVLTKKQSLVYAGDLCRVFEHQFEGWDSGIPSDLARGDLVGSDAQADFHAGARPVPGVDAESHTAQARG